MGSELGITAESQAAVNLSPVSIWWAVWAGVWTAAVAAGMVYLIINRDMPALRIRGLALSLSSIVLLHLYWLACQFGTMVGALMPGDGQYWIMGTYLPCGIALFHASNSRFLHVAKLQRKYAQHGFRFTDASPDEKPKTGLINRFRRLDYTTKILITVGAAMFAQIFLTILMYIISRKWHSSWGIPGTEVHGSEMAQKTAQGTGWEWWPGVFWQFFWSWVVAPVILWKARNIHDTQGWRVQTIGCAIGSLHATPMWLIALYVPAMAPVNQYWIPPQWICLSILIIEIFTVFLPCWEVVRHQSLRQETLDSIARWETKVKASGSENKSINSDATIVESIMSGWKSTNDSIKSSGSRDSILTMSALEHVLERNPTPLQEFSALREFSGENIAFLTSVAEWKSSLPAALRDSTSPRSGSTKDLFREHFNRALHIYAEFISVRHAEFPVNISSHDLKKLEEVFERPARILYGEEREADPVSPFDKFTFEPASPTVSESSEKEMTNCIRNRVHYWGEIPEEFDANVFQDAEASIKYLVLTNTWPKFIKDRRTSITSFETLKPGMEVV
ncbi:uncharacterized protein N7482_010701 [Penicillium canariense]|uniref:Regulator of G protein signaling superfamily n=1 Tax=Penicillium canariense TaxID=189055 RepID=A0A9W9LEB3_9EURO|nr:uncharacterized protein N7482_010701 [Penicillium canariense]KAJ5151449.1 hypothetical protein N7482_010701 [Penicillium canariense]